MRRSCSSSHAQREAEVGRDEWLAVGFFFWWGEVRWDGSALLIRFVVMNLEVMVRFEAGGGVVFRIITATVWLYFARRSLKFRFLGFTGRLILMVDWYRILE